MPEATEHGESFAEVREHIRRRYYDEATDSHSGRRMLLAGILAVLLFLAICALALRQATSAGSAQNVLGAGIARITDIDQLLAQDLPADAQQSSATASQSVPLPGFPIDINLTRADLTGRSTAEIRTLVLDRAAARAYDDGIHAFDRTGDQSVSRFSGVGLMTTMANQLTRKNHDRATLALIVLAALTAIVAGALVVVSEDGHRTRPLAVAVLVAALPGVLLAGTAWLAIGSIGGSDPFESALRSLTRSVIGVPLRDFVIVAILGVVMLVAGPVAGLFARPFGQGMTTEGPEADLYEIGDEDDEADEDIEAEA